MLIYFSDDLFLFACLPLLLSLNFVLPTSSNEPVLIPTQNLLKKKNFFIHLRAAQILLVGATLLTVVMNYNIVMSLSAVDQIFFQFGNFLFRKDKLVLVGSLLITLSGLYYLYLLGFCFMRSATATKYFSEIPFLVITTTLCLRLFLATNDLFLLALLVEIAAFCSIILIGIQSLSPLRILLPIEAAIKYFIINAVAISLLFLAFILYFFLTAKLNVIDIASFFDHHPEIIVFSFEQIIFVQLLFFFAYFIKIGAAPVHQWVPDVYEGAETAITAFLVILISPVLVLKCILFMKQFLVITNSTVFILYWFRVAGVFSIAVGTINAFYQTKIKRFIAYAGLTHLGFILIALSVNTLFGYFAALFYLVVYYLTNLGFFTLFIFAQQHLNFQLIYINQLKSLLHNSTFFFYSFLIILLSFAGIPPFAGFFIKFFVLLAVLNQNAVMLVVIIILAILMGTFLYLRFFKIALFEQTKLSKIAKLTYADFYVLAKQKNEKKVAVSKKTLWEKVLINKILIPILFFLSTIILFLPFVSSIIFDLTLTILLFY
jgi:NADH-quinone oxidoreductase subunit N